MSPIIEIIYNEEYDLENWGELAIATPGSAGFDVRACIKVKEDDPDTITIKPGQTKIISLGFKIDICNPGIAALLLPRSGLGIKKGLVLGNLVGLIDSDYQGTVMAGSWNRNIVTTMTLDPEDLEITITHGDKIGQMIFVPVIIPQLSRTDSFDRSTRGENGLGSTGVA